MREGTETLGVLQLVSSKFYLKFNNEISSIAGHTKQLVVDSARTSSLPAYTSKPEDMAKCVLPDVSPQRSRGVSWKAIATTAIVSATVALYAERILLPLVFESLGALLGVTPSTPSASATQQCRPPLPNLFAQTPISNSNPSVRKALRSVDAYVCKSFTEAGSAMDGLAVAVVTANGAIYEAGLGPLKANETDPEKRRVIDRHSIFRLASGSKLFAVLETLVLREKGALQWFVNILSTSFWISM